MSLELEKSTLLFKLKPYLKELKNKRRQQKTFVMGQLVSHLILILSLCIMFLPLYLALITSTYDSQKIMSGTIPWYPGPYFYKNLHTIFIDGLAATGGKSVGGMLINSLIMAMVTAVGKVGIAMASAFALVYFDFKLKKLCFYLIFITMMLPIEVRVIPTFQVIASLQWLNSFTGLTLPLMASATATFLFRQFFKTIPKELVDASKLDGAGPLRFFWNILLPLSMPQIIALFIIMFVYGWNQYLWPLVITTNPSMTTIVMGIKYLSAIADEVPQWHLIMMTAIMALIPPCLVVIVLQRWFEKGLNH